MLARAQRLHPQFDAKTGRQRQHHSLYPFISQQRRAIVVERPHRMGRGGLLRQFVLHVGDGHQFDLIGSRSRLRVDRADRPTADDAEL